jgi:hypothetical protein|tara:strand:- start:569 stop:1018 length:450 start_codon:yes stop_codon:yes gene_type:complete
MAKLPPKPLQSEILQAVSSAKTKKQKIEILQEYRSPALVSLFVWNYDDSVKSAIPEGNVPYTPNDAPTPEAQSKLASQYRTLYNYVKGGNDALRQVKRESLFIELLESLHPDEAELVCLVKDKDLTKKYRVTHNVVKEAYPDVEWGGRG